MSRAMVEEDSTAVLAFDDGTRIPADRFLLRSFCGVIRRLMEDSTCDLDDRGRTVVPIPSQSPDPYWVAVDVLHGVAGIWGLDLPQTLGTTACMEYLGVTAHDAALNMRLWYLVKDGDLEAILPHAPRLLRDPTVSAVAMRRLIQLRPVWTDFRDDVLVGLRDPDLHVLAAVASYAPNFFPPALVVCWALDAAPRTLTQDVALRLMSQHGVMYHPNEVPVVLRKMMEQAEARGWDASFAPFLRNLVSSVDVFDAVPGGTARVRGTVVKFHDIPIASVAVTVDGPRCPSVARLTPWLKTCFDAEGRLDVRFKPRAIDTLSRFAAKVQLRVMAFDRKNFDGQCAEAWYVFDVLAQDVELGLTDATTVLGWPASLSSMMRAGQARQVRLDFFFGAHSVLDNPFDPTSAMRSTSAVSRIF